MIFFRPPGVLRVLVSAEKGLTPVLMAFFEWCAPVVAGRSPAPAPGGRFSSGPPLPAPHTAAALPARAAKRPRAEAALWEVVVCVVVGGRVGVKGGGGGGGGGGVWGGVWGGGGVGAGGVGGVWGGGGGGGVGGGGGGGGGVGGSEGLWGWGTGRESAFRGGPG